MTGQRIVIRDMVVTCSIGVSESERATRQRLQLNLEIEVQPQAPAHDEISEVVHYGHLVTQIREICLNSAVCLLETLADTIAEVCFADARVRAVRLRVEKLDRYPDVGGVGVEIDRERA